MMRDRKKDLIGFSRSTERHSSIISFLRPNLYGEEVDNSACVELKSAAIFSNS